MPVRRVPPLDPEKISEVLGAEEALSEELQDADGRKFMLIKCTTAGREEQKKIYRLSDTELANHRLLGEARGAGFWHCIYMGVKFCKDFRKDVAGYVIRPPERPLYPVVIAFYAKNP